MSSGVLLTALLGTSRGPSDLRADGGFGQMCSEFEDPDPALNAHYFEY